jgi:hypothetical protein
VRPVQAIVGPERLGELDLTWWFECDIVSFIEERLRNLEEYIYPTSNTETMLRWEAAKIQADISALHLYNTIHFSLRTSWTIAVVLLYVVRTIG